MRNSETGFAPASSHATSSSRDCSGVISIWSRAITGSACKALRSNARGVGGGCGSKRPQTHKVKSGSSRRRGFFGGGGQRLMARTAEPVEQTTKFCRVRIGQFRADMLFDRRRIGGPHLFLQFAPGLGDFDELAALVDLAFA